MVLGYFHRRKQKKAEAEAAFRTGQQVADELSKDVFSVVDGFCEPRVEKFLMILDHQLTGIEPVEGVSFQEQGKIHLKIMWDHWNERRAETKETLTQSLQSKWKQVTDALGADQISEMVSSRVDWHTTNLFTQGMDRVMEAVDRQGESF
jgi:hypothetical protein